MKYFPGHALALPGKKNPLVGQFKEIFYEYDIFCSFRKNSNTNGIYKGPLYDNYNLWRILHKSGIA